MKEKTLNKELGRVVLTYFFFSGVCGSIYLITWLRLLHHFLGPPILSILSTIIIFLGGLALGSYLAGQYIDTRPDPLKIYGLLEGILGIYSLFLPWLIQWTIPLYRFTYQNIQPSFHTSLFLRYLVFPPMLLIPTTLIGATWPVMSKLLVQKMDNLGWTIGKVFGVNILGASIGILATQFFFLPHIGLRNTIYFAASIDLLICICSLFIYKKVQLWRSISKELLEGQTSDEVLPKKWGRYSHVRRIILLGYGISGFAAMIYQVICLRDLIIFLDSSFSALFLVLSAFLLGVSLGNISLAGFIDQREDPLLILGAIETVIGLSCLAIIPLLEKFPRFIPLIMERYAHSFWLLQFMQFFLFFFIMLIPTLLMGLAFPAVCRIYSDTIKTIGQSISAVFSIYAFGSLLGVLSGGIFLINWLSMKEGVLIAFWAFIFIGTLFFVLSYSISRIMKIALSLLMAGVFIFFSFFLPIGRMTILKEWPGRYVQNGTKDLAGYDLNQVKGLEKKEETLFYKEGMFATVCITRGKDDMDMQVNGKTVCLASRDIPAQILNGHIPMLLHNHPKDVLLIGLESGITLGSMMRYPVHEIDCVEISERVIEGAVYFHELNHLVLNDNRLKLMIEDGRHYLMFTDQKYDVIIAQPLSGWPDAINDFCTEEFFGLCRKRLRSGGIAAIKLSAQEMNKKIFQFILYTWHKVFPFMNLWETELGTHYLLIGSNQPIKIDFPLLFNRLKEENIASDLTYLHIKDPSVDILSFFFMDQQGINADYQNMKDFGDDFALMEFFALNLTHGKKSEGLVEDIQYYRGSGLHNLLVNTDGTHDPEWRVMKEKIDKAIKAKRYLTKAYIDLIKKEPRDKILKGIKEALQINPDDEKAIELYSQIIFEVVDENINLKQFNSALWTIREIISIMPDNPKTLYLLGKTYYHMGLIDQAVAEFEKAVESGSEDEEIRCHLGMAYLNKGWIDLSIVQFNRAIRINPDYAEPYLYLGAAYFKKDLIDQAIEEYRNAVSRKADYADAHYNLGIAYLKQGLIDEAIAEWQEVIRIRPNDVNSRYNLAMAYYNHGEIAQSITLLEELLRIKPDFTQASSLLHILNQLRQ